MLEVRAQFARRDLPPDLVQDMVFALCTCLVGKGRVSRHIERVAGVKGRHVKTGLVEIGVVKAGLVEVGVELELAVRQ